MFREDVELLIEPLRHTDPRTWQALQTLNRQLFEISVELEPLTQQSTLPPGGISTIDSPLSFSAVSTGTTVRFSWSGVSGAVQYEVRKGLVWETADFQFRTTNLTADIDPVLYGDHTYLIKTLDINDAYSVTPTPLIFSVTQIPAPDITGKVIDNNVLLTWTAPDSTFNIRYFILTKDGVQIGTSPGTFATIFETVSGIYTYGITAVDIAGNIGLETLIPVRVNQPPDFALQDRRVSTFSGTKVNTHSRNRLGTLVLLCSWVATTYQDHFTTRAWLTPQNQITAGYPIYIQPSSTTGSYEEVVDYGVILNNLIAIITYNINVITPASAVAIVVKMAVSNDNVSYTSFVSGSSQFYAQFRYLKFKLEFTGVDDKALIELSELTTSIDVKRENDGGEVTALSTDVGGTQVFFNKAFKDIESLTVTIKSTNEPYIAIFNFVDIANPTHFFVFALDSTGNRVTKVADWKARGVI